MKKTFAALMMILCLLALSAPIVALAQGPSQCDVEYTVQAGDWLSKIAEEYYGDPLAYPVLVEAAVASADDNYHDITDPDLIEPGWMICIPAVPPGGEAATSTQLSPEALSNMTYQTEWTADGSAELENGFYSEPGPPGAGFATSVRLDDQYTAYGQLNGQDAAAVVLEIMLSGTGTLYDLAVVIVENGTPVNVATTNLGNQVKVNTVTIQEDEVVVDMVAHGSDDHPCCPSQGVIRHYALQGDQLVLSGEESLGKVILPADLSPVTLENMTYLSSWTQSGTAELVDGEYREPTAPGSATETVIRLDTRSYPRGEINGRASVPVFLRVDPGGSGTFYDLAVVSDVEGQPVNVAVTTLGEGVEILDHRIVEGEIEVNLLSPASDAPVSASPSEQYLRRYALRGDELVMADETYLGSYPGTYQGRLTPEEVTFDVQGLAGSVDGQAIPATPYNRCCPPGPTGTPDHLLYNFDGEPRLSIYPIQEWEDQWNAAGNDSITVTADRLRALLAEQPGSPPAPLPLLPPPGGTNDIAAQVSYLDFANGSGVRYLGRFAQSMNPVLATDFRYVYQGLTEDGQYLVSFAYPVVIDALPSDISQVSQEEMARMQADYDAYRQGVVETLNSLEPADVSPSLDQLDALVTSLEFTSP